MEQIKRLAIENEYKNSKLEASEKLDHKLWGLREFRFESIGRTMIFINVQLMSRFYRIFCRMYLDYVAEQMALTLC